MPLFIPCFAEGKGKRAKLYSARRSLGISLVLVMMPAVMVMHMHMNMMMMLMVRVMLMRFVASVMSSGLMSRLCRLLAVRVARLLRGSFGSSHCLILYEVLGAAETAALAAFAAAACACFSAE